MSQEDHNQSHRLRTLAAAAGGSALIISAIIGLVAEFVKRGAFDGIFSSNPTDLEEVSPVGTSPKDPPGPENPPNTPQAPTEPVPPTEPEPQPVADVLVPDGITSVYVFYQDKSLQSADGCVREPSAQGVPPSVFEAGIDDFIGNAQEQTKSLIITAHNPNKSVPWDGAEDIKINGESLTPQVTYWCNEGNPSPGFEYPI